MARTRDHIIPRSKGGTNSNTNMVDSCSQCNFFKASLTLDEFTALVDFHIKHNKGYKQIPLTKFPLIKDKAEKLKAYVNKKGELLYLASKREKKQSLVGEYLRRHKPQESKIEPTPAYPQERSYLSDQTLEEFRERKKRDENIKRMLAEPEPNFHF